MKREPLEKMTWENGSRTIKRESLAVRQQAVEVDSFARRKRDAFRPMAGDADFDGDNGDYPNFWLAGSGSPLARVQL